MAQPEVQNGAGTGEVVEAATAVFSALKPQLLVKAPMASEAVKFFKAAFGPEEIARTVQTKRKVDQEVPHISAQLLPAGSTIVDADAADLDAVWMSELAAIPNLLSVLRKDEEDVSVTSASA